MDHHTNELTIRPLYPFIEGGPSASTDDGPVADAVEEGAIAEEDGEYGQEREDCQKTAHAHKGRGCSSHDPPCGVS